MHRAKSFSFGPILEVALIFVGLFLCLGPIEVRLVEAAPQFPVRSAWQLFWGSGVLSSVLDNAPTYTAFAALARGLPSQGAALVAGIDCCAHIFFLCGLPVNDLEKKQKHGAAILARNINN